VPKEKAQTNRLCLAQADAVRLRFPLETPYNQKRHEDTLLGSLVVAIAALGSSIVTTTVFALPTSTPLGQPSRLSASTE
jgi:hypothetical protein